MPLSKNPSRLLVQRWRQLCAAPEGLRPIRVGVAASYTVEPLLPFLGCALADRGLFAQFLVAPYNQIYQSLLDPGSELRRERLDVAVVLPRLEELIAPSLRGMTTLDPAEVGAAQATARAEIDRLLAALGEFGQAAQCPTVCGNFEPASSTPLGVLDATHAASDSGLRTVLNQQLAAGVRAQRGLVFDVAALVAEVGTRQAFDPRMFYVSRHPYSTGCGRALMAGLARLVAPLFIAPAKVIVLDLDNTLWGGVVGEDGPTGVALGESGVGAAFVDFQDALLAYRRQGVLLCIASKNNEVDAWEVIDHHPAMRLRRDHFAAWRINWNRKSDSLRELAEELSLGVDSFVFLDDSGMECDEMRRMLPQVTVVHLPEDVAQYVACLRAIPALDRVVLTDEDRQRAEQYRVARQRNEAEAAAGSDPEKLAEYLRTLELSVFVRRPTPADVPRVAQLTQKTNQFNVTTIRRTEAEINALLNDEHWLVYAIDVRDRFGDYGLVGVMLVVERGGGEAEIDTLLLSCRVLGRGVETVLLGHLIEDLGRRGGRRLRGRFVPTKKNTPAKDFFAAHGFSDSGDGVWLLDPLREGAFLPPHIERRSTVDPR